VHSRGFLLVVVCALVGCRQPAEDPVGGDAPNRSAQALPPAERAVADILAGHGHLVWSSGLDAGWPSPAYDRETGLRLENQGCEVSPGDDAYNAAVRRWVAAAGPPKESMKRRMLDPALISAALADGRDLEPGASARAPDGRVVSLHEHELSVSGGAFGTAFRERVLTREATPRLRIAWGPDGSVLLAVDYPSSHFATDAAYVQIDPICRCLLQVFDGRPWGGPLVPTVDP
jgi:hypothetical protein